MTTDDRAVRLALEVAAAKRERDDALAGELHYLNSFESAMRERDGLLIERDALRAEVERLREALDGGA